MRPALPLGLALLLLGTAQAQQLYRWTDDKGRTHITDTPPPASAKDVQTKSASTPGPEPAPQNFELAQAMKDFPVVLYTGPACKDACVRARGALNKRGVPFREVQVWDEASAEELKRVSSGDRLPVLVVGRSVEVGFEQGAYDALLDAARYPKAGVLPARSQAAPPPPEGYATAQPVTPEAEEPKPAGPYAPGAPRQRGTKK